MDEPTGLLVDDGDPEVTAVRPAPDPREVPEVRDVGVPVRRRPEVPLSRPRHQRERVDLPAGVMVPEAVWCWRCAADRSDHRRPLPSADDVAQFDVCATCLTALEPLPSGLRRIDDGAAADAHRTDRRSGSHIPAPVRTETE
jgi:hypothetical protein